METTAYPRPAHKPRRLSTTNFVDLKNTIRVKEKERITKPTLDKGENRSLMRVFRRDMMGFPFQFIELPITVLFIALLHIFSGACAVYIVYKDIVRMGSFRAALSPYNLGLAMIAFFNLAIGAVSFSAALMEFFFERKLNRRKKNTREGKTRRPPWTLRAIQSLGIGLSTNMCCLTVHCIAVNFAVARKYQQGMTYVDGSVGPWILTGQDIASWVLYDSLYIAFVFFFIGSMNITMSLTRRIAIARHYRINISKTKRPERELKTIARVMAQVSACDSLDHLGQDKVLKEFCHSVESMIGYSESSGFEPSDMYEPSYMDMMYERRLSVRDLNAGFFNSKLDPRTVDLIPDPGKGQRPFI